MHATCIRVAVWNDGIIAKECDVSKWRLFYWQRRNGKIDDMQENLNRQREETQEEVGGAQWLSGCDTKGKN